MSSIRFTTTEKDYHLAIAAEYTASRGWRADAIAVAAYDDGAERADQNQIRGIFVLQNFDGFGADVHFALAPGRHNTRRLVQSLLTFSFHPSWQNLPSLRAFIPITNVEMQQAALHMGFQVVARLPSGVMSMDDAILMVLKQEDCRWTLPVTRGTEKPEA